MRYFTETHRENSEAAMRYVAESKKQSFSYQEATMQQLQNSKSE
jgi:hypothetical protein